MAGTITARYGPDAQLTGMDLPGGVSLTTTLDPSGQATSRVYQRTTDAALIASSSQVSNIRGQALTQTGPASNKTFGYDRWGRLTSTSDVATADGSCTRRLYAYDRHTNRTSKITQVGTPGNPCPGDVDPITTTETHTYDSADRATDAGYTYDAFGRITALPGLTSTYYTNDLIASQTSSTFRMTYNLDPLQRLRSSYRDAVSGGLLTGASITTISHYGDDTDNPRWTEDGDAPSVVQRSVLSPDGKLAVVTGKTAAEPITLQMTNLHGDLMMTAYIAPGSTQPTLTARDTDEFGILNPATQPLNNDNRFGWLGAQQRSGDTTGNTILMGVRVYHTTTGRFLQPDPIPGGSANAYDYCGADPINKSDLGGTRFLADGGGGGWSPPGPPRVNRGGGIRGGGGYYHGGTSSRIDWNTTATVVGWAAFGVCVFFSAGACLVAGLVAGAISAYATARCISCESFRNNFAINAAFAIGGAGIGRFLGKAYESLERGPGARMFNSIHGPHVRIDGRFRARWNWIRGYGYHRYHMHGYHWSYYKGSAELGLVGTWGNTYATQRWG